MNEIERALKNADVFYSVSNKYYSLKIETHRDIETTENIEII